VFDKFVGAFYSETRVVFLGICIEYCADFVVFDEDGFGGFVAMRAFETHVFDEMTRTVLVRGFVYGAYMDKCVNGGKW
jgi:hypothetical protein